MGHAINLKDIFPLPLDDNSYFDLSQGEIYIRFKRDIFIWGMVFQKATFKQKTKLQIQISNERDTDGQNIGYSNSFSKYNNEWINPDGSDPNTPLELEFAPADMDDGGCIFFTKPSNPDKIMSFVATHVKIKGVSGQLNKIVFDFVGSSITYDGKNGVLENAKHHLTSNFWSDRYIANIYYTGKQAVITIMAYFYDFL